ncbi:MBL fold metallo-hydrolase [Saccharopolyspora karakumensis]|uniref:MBL fold metallo-hydrolase n=1 Tax=Saccharopolyspora karakumensis TaxID=2530386 RepID=A0A4R5BU05_9PSEU|nr:MBL fold metallo-hydrolase [Saccharopolyspora karakumensis]TDD89156.1 MBL fold metallo-hydrolase [Saccharopolyspora karakumensis]
MSETTSASTKLSRRSLLGKSSTIAVAAAGSAWAASCDTGSESAAVEDGTAPASPGSQGDRLVLLGTGGGPIWWPGTDRRGFAAAVVANEKVYLIDCGAGVGERLKQAYLVPPEKQKPDRSGGLEQLRGVFLTHLHSDHTIDYFNLFLYGWFNGLRDVESPVDVYGPGRRGELEPVFTPPGKKASEPPVINPENPTPGTVDMTEYLYQAYALDVNDRMRDGGQPNLRDLVHVHDIDPPLPQGFDPNETPAPSMDPFLVHEDENVRVTATLVDHRPMFPAFGFRFDTPSGSVVFSGDTCRSENLIELARDCDLLVHEVISWDYINRASSPAGRNHLLQSHTPVDQVGRVAADCGARTLVLAHIVPGNCPDEKLLAAQEGYTGELVIGRDLMQIPLRG